MCSICGYLSKCEMPTDIVKEMLKEMKHRGLDACGMYVDGDIITGIDGIKKVRIIIEEEVEKTAP